MQSQPDGHLKCEGIGRGEVSQAGQGAGQADDGEHCASGEGTQYGQSKAQGEVRVRMARDEAGK